MNFESQGRGNFDARESREPEGFPHLSKALEKADKRVYSCAIDPKTFAKPNGPYEQSSVERDLEYMKKVEKNILEKNLDSDYSGSHAKQEAMRKVAHVYEAMVLDNIDNGWLGENAQTIVPARFDDIVNGVDGIVEFRDENHRFSHLALAMDVTSSPDVSRKLERLLKEIESGKLTMIRYFESDSMRIQGEKRNIPRVIVGADRQTIADMMTPWVSDHATIELRKHPFQIQMIDEIVMQLNAFKQYAEKRGQRHLVGIFQSDLLVMADVIAEKKQQFGDSAITAMRREISQDKVYQSLKNAIKPLLNGEDILW